MRASSVVAIALASLVSHVTANTEKVIFVAPEPDNIPTAHPTLDNLYLDVLTPDDTPHLRTHLQVAAPLQAKTNHATADDDDGPPSDPATGTATWLLLYHLTASQRYELRVCWAATQPTEFTIDTYSLTTVFETPELMASLAAYAENRIMLETSDAEMAKEAFRSTLLSSASSSLGGEDDADDEIQASVLFLRIVTAAEYFSDDPAKMDQADPVKVDIILDPYLMNALPRSLSLTVVYVVAVAVASYFVSQQIRDWIRRATAKTDEEALKKES